MPIWPFKWSPKGTEEALLRIEKARKDSAQTLDLSGLELSALPETIGQLSQLQVLNLANNYLSARPDAVRSLGELRCRTVRRRFTFERMSEHCCPPAWKTPYPPPTLGGRVRCPGKCRLPPSARTHPLTPAPLCVIAGWRPFCVVRAFCGSAVVASARLCR